MSRTSKWGGFVAGWYASSCAIIFTNKFLLTDRSFKFPFTLAAITNTTVFAISWITTLATGQRPDPLPWRTTVRVVGPIGLLTAMDIGMSNWALVQLSVALHTIVRGTVPAFVLAFSLLLGLDKPSWRIAGSILTVCVGIGFAAYGDVDCDALGLGLALLSCVFSGLRWAMTQVLVKASAEGDQHALAGALANRHRSPVASIYYVTPACALCSAAAAWLLERRALMASTEEVLTFIRGELLLYNCAIGLLVFVLLFCEFGLVRLTSSLSLSVLGVAKELMTILVAAYTRGDQITPTNLAGFLMCAAGILAYQTGSSKADEAQVPLSPSRTCGDAEAAAFADGSPGSGGGEANGGAPIKRARELQEMGPCSKQYARRQQDEERAHRARMATLTAADGSVAHESTRLLASPCVGAALGGCGASGDPGSDVRSDHIGEAESEKLMLCP